MSRTEGSTNKNKAFLNARLKAMYGKDFDPIMMMAEQAVRLHAAAIDSEDGTKSLVESITAWDKIAQYIQPKLKAIEHTGADGNVLTIEHKGLKVEFTKSSNQDT